MHNPDTDRTPVTVIGLGLMGRALTGAFLRAGHPTTVWNRTAAKADELVAQGAWLADSVGDAVAAGQLVVVCVADYAAVHELLDPVEDAIAGRVLVSLTSGTPATGRDTAEWATRLGATYLDGAIMDVPAAIGTEDAVLLYSGPRQVFDRHEATLRVLGGRTTYLGPDPGLAALYDVALLSMMWNTLNGFLQGAAVLGAAGVDAAAFGPIAVRGLGIVSDWLPGYAEQIDAGAYPALDSTLDTHRAAMNHLVDEAESLGVNTELARLIRALADRAVVDGHGGSGYAALIEQFRKPAGRPA